MKIGYVLSRWYPLYPGITMACAPLAAQFPWTYTLGP
jgi:hypothetical protein